MACGVSSLDTPDPACADREESLLLALRTLSDSTGSLSRSPPSGDCSASALIGAEKVEVGDAVRGEE